MTNTERLAGLTDAEVASEVERLQILGPRQVVQVLAAAMARLRRPAPKALAEAWGCVNEGGRLVPAPRPRPGLVAPLAVFATAADAEEWARCSASGLERVVRVQVAEVPS